MCRGSVISTFAWIHLRHRKNGARSSDCIVFLWFFCGFGGISVLLALFLSSLGKNKVKEHSCIFLLLCEGYYKTKWLPCSNVKTRLEQSSYYLASGRFPLQNTIYDNKLPFSRM